MRLIFLSLALIWLFASTALMAFVALAMRQGYNSDWPAALYEGFETIPEALMMMCGFGGSPVWVDVLYWIIPVVVLLFAFRARRAD